MRASRGYVLSITVCTRGAPPRVSCFGPQRAADGTLTPCATCAAARGSAPRSADRVAGLACEALRAGEFRPVD
eukprot:CAMPEP_0116982494 /NCGR_PEP_ID=MMETSP0467-20121206/60361_1 /TAXON_ID=283647 /ORGANISM="Mesodinium pulex, Strain SPMC105" /LENGTH=72 /DNA_ID=CAMNT_0004676967 /DNA_START=9 /DNA_END=230 /DNA_ORIENTATION=+